jgi:hypothetical protein
MLTERWNKLRHHTQQQEYLRSDARFNVVPAGRRSGKTECAKRKGIMRAITEAEWSDAWFVFAAPTHSQAKRIFWSDLKAMIPKSLIRGIPSEGTLSIRLVNGAEITVLGLDAPERVEGRPVNGVVLDEYGNMKESVWMEHLRPALSDRRGWVDFIGVPEGRNHYYDLYKNAQADETGDWATFTWTSEDILDADEITAAKRDLDELTYNQEYKASFVTFEGQAYYAFDEKVHAVGGVTYDPNDDLIFCFDFNVSPGTAVICQETKEQTNVVAEVYIPNNSNTPAVCNRLIADWKDHKGSVLCYGDATGGARGTAQIHGSDWDLIKNTLRPVFGSRLKFRVDKANPKERVRVNAMNSRLMGADGTVKLRVDAAKAPMTVKDLEGVRLLAGGSGEIDKKVDPKLTHLTDALGYYVVKRHPVRPRHISTVQEVL